MNTMSFTYKWLSRHCVVNSECDKRRKSLIKNLAALCGYSPFQPVHDEQVTDSLMNTSWNLHSQPQGMVASR